LLDLEKPPDILYGHPLMLGGVQGEEARQLVPLGELVEENAKLAKVKLAICITFTLHIDIL
jgi:hypothetical protein